MKDIDGFWANEACLKVVLERRSDGIEIKIVSVNETNSACTLASATIAYYRFARLCEFNRDQVPDGHVKEKK